MDEFQATLDAATADVWQRYLDPLGRVYAAELRRIGRAAAKRFKRYHGAVTAAGEPDWHIPHPDELVDPINAASDMQKRTHDIRQQVAETAIGGIMARYGLAFNLADPTVQNALTQMGQHITKIVESQRQTIMQSLADSYAKGLSITKAAQAMVEQTDIDSVRRGEIIARTELTGATNGAGLAAARTVTAASPPGTGLVKAWLSAGDDRVRDDHQAADDDYSDNPIPLDQPFIVGGYPMDHPGDPSGPPEEVINCRCTVVYTQPAGGQEPPVPEGAAEVPFELIPVDEDDFSYGADVDPDGSFKFVAQGEMTGDGYENISYYKEDPALNDDLRHDPPSNYALEQAESIESQMGVANRDFITYRGISDRTLARLFADGEEEAIGKVIDDPAFVSTSTDIDQASGFDPNIMIIRVPRGAPVVSIEKALGKDALEDINWNDLAGHDTEREVLLPTNSRFLVRGVRKSEFNDSHRIFVDLLPRQAAAVAREEEALAEAPPSAASWYSKVTISPAVNSQAVEALNQIRKMVNPPPGLRVSIKALADAPKDRLPKGAVGYFDPATRTIYVDPSRGAEPVVHEMAHAIWFQWMTNKPGLTNTFRLAARQTKWYEGAQMWLADMEADGDVEEAKRMKYLMLPDEMFARAFSQLIAESSHQGPLVDDLEKKIAVGSAWEHDDFDQLGEWFTTMFSAHGLIA